MSPRPDVSKERKGQILEAAMNVFARLGFERARMDDISVESGLSKGALYWYFKSKDAVIASLLEYFFGQEIAGVKDLPAQSGSARARLNLFLDRTLKEFAKMRPLLPITYAFYSLAFRDKGVRKAVRNYLRQYTEILSALIAQGIAQGEFRRVDPTTTALAMEATFEGTLLLWVFDPQMIKLEEQLTADLRLLLQGLEKK